MSDNIADTIRARDGRAQVAPMYFSLVSAGHDVAPLLAALQRQPELFDVYSERRKSHGDIESPHKEMTDIWLRHNDRRPFDSGERPWSEFNDPHDAVWYPSYDRLPESKPLIFDAMRHTEAEHLGGILLTKLPPGKSIMPHTDHGWHAQVHEKLMLHLQCDEGAIFGFPEEQIMRAQAGDLYWFRNDIPHWIYNGSRRDRVVMIISIRRQKGSAWTI